MSPDAVVVRDFLDRAARRLRLIAAARGAAIGLTVALGATLVVVALAGRDATSVVVGVGLGALGGLVGAFLGVTRTPAPAALVERRAPACRNVVLTAAELDAAPRRVPAFIGERVWRDAARAVRPLDPARLFSAGRALFALGGAALAWAAVAAALFLLPLTVPPASPAGAGTAEAVGIARVVATVTPPAYSRREATRLEDPARIEALAGSSVRLAVHARADLVRVETVAGVDTLRGAADVFTADIAVDADGYIALEAVGTGGGRVRRLIGVVATPDRGPSVRITTPERDLTVPDGRRTLDVAVEAEDDIALASLALTFTRVTGSGEQYSFVDGAVPLDVTRAGGTWRGRGTLRLDTLRLEPGDMVVYRGLARDGRPGAPAAESDARFVELAAPGNVPMEGFSADEDDRYALSQQMVLVKTERLIARASWLAPDSLAAEAALIAAEQRSVRAEFVFMMGGELEEDIAAEASMDDLNEEAHAELDDEAIAGRLRNRGRLDLLRAIRAMSRANAALLDSELERARAEERAAIDLLQTAFSRTRYILRALTERERLDPSRRLSGDLAGVGRTVRPAADAEPAPRTVALRRALADVAALSGARAEDAAGAYADAALDVLRIDPSSAALRSIAAVLDSAAAAVAAGAVEDARPRIERAAVALAAQVRAALGGGPAPAPTLEGARLRGALADALRRERP
jgi:hypothetical protein